MTAFPFPKLLAFLESEADQVEFMKVAAEVGLSASDHEIAKLLVALQIYKAYYAAIPREIQSLNAAAVDEIARIRSEVREIHERTAAESARIAEWAGRIHESISAVRPETVIEALHGRLLEETMATLRGSVEALTGAYNRLDTASGKMNAAAEQAEAGIQQWQVVTLRRVWFSALFFSIALNGILNAVLWFHAFKH
jgi:prefoldin subunit 5